MTLVQSFDGVRLAVVDEGEGVPVLMAHSLGADHRIWDPVAAELRTAGFRTIRYDLRGHGASDVPDGPYDVAMFGKDMVAILDALGIARAHAVGLSVGGMAAMWLAVNAPDRVDRLVLANTTPFIPVKDRWDPLIAEALDAGLDGIAKPMILGWLSAGFKAEQPDAAVGLVNAMLHMPPAGFAGTCAILRDVDLRADLSRIAAPTLVVHGVEDERGVPASAALVSHIAGAVRADIADAAHLSPAENPGQVARAILEFLA
ncbi:alpha/beta fold hydrolase [Sphingomonas sp. AOB5]|uniref:alpha/beta fold hydrolase n=1 Tax=Sphingomonas sp. AOB5 TaxID=3034017 RepID=UPI0023F65748|nr:alpha/beta fold hydrolase [Sphingomonas sp. AOB5]MDF7775391.1 alpha/beta fold hydrolase [Sphingomonas sp. AOB5]